MGFKKYNMKYWGKTGRGVGVGGGGASSRSQICNHIYLEEDNKKTKKGVKTKQVNCLRHFAEIPLCVCHFCLIFTLSMGYGPDPFFPRFCLHSKTPGTFH